MADKYELQFKAGENSWITLQTAGLIDPIDAAFTERYKSMKRHDYRVVRYSEEILYVASDIRAREAEEEARKAAEADKQDPFSPG